MFSRVLCASIRGVSIFIVNVEVDVSNGLPSLDMVGLLNSEVKESKERVRTAIKNTGFIIPPKKITVSLSPADARKEGGSFDLPIAIGILAALGIVNSEDEKVRESLFVGELSLDGKINSVNGILPIIISAKELGIKRFFVPKDNYMEGSVIKNVEIIGIENLKEVVEILNGQKPMEPEFINIENFVESQNKEDFELDFSQVYGQSQLKRAAVIAAGGRHNILLVGTPGSGKSMVAERMHTILPSPSIDECIEITKIHSISGKLNGRAIITKRPFRAPHHSVSSKGLIGGGVKAKPGEITLAHKGILFLDELTEFKNDVIEALRQPIESKKVIISRINGTYEFPADVMLIAATNPCKCGYYPDRSKCSCTEHEVSKYLGKISGPMLDRIDIVVSSPPVMIEELSKYKKHESSKEMKKKVEAVCFIQKERYKNTEIKYNSELSPEDIKKYCYMGEKEKRLLEYSFEKLNLSARSYYKTIKVARTIADMEGMLNIGERHIAEAIGYRAWK